MTQRGRELKDVSHEYLVESMQVLEAYVADMLTMILQFHPYMGPTADELGKHAQDAQMQVEKRYPVSAIVTPITGLIKPH